ncbi:alpha/beta hydrolase [Ruegeria sp. 2012CJ41-6]|uniref:Alpha/beta hydrolase n=1 Tax=Ruegeria spongiae TaxID=2942209 RepID=A0ABT0Q614_9RHOB|nr:alpha/beta hydrolase [Ruegeria spongiae]MCL6285316.1 alpha/beta hydrolase [Ruegeria spongiae]
MSDTMNIKPDARPTQNSAGRSAARRILIGVLVAAVAAYLSAMAYMYLFQRSFVFKPGGEVAAPVVAGVPEVSVDTIRMADGTEVIIWTAPPTMEDAPTVLFFHGNSGNLSDRADRFRHILDSGYGLYAPGYRGYPGSGGAPSEVAFVADGLEHFDRLSGGDAAVIVHGQSLGTGVATAVAAQRAGIDLLVLEAPYTATVDMAAEQYPWLPVSFLMKDPFVSRDRIGQVDAPVFIAHGTADEVIPVAHGEALFGFANDPRSLMIVEGADHGNLWSHGLWDEVQRQIDGRGQ